MRYDATRPDCRAAGGAMTASFTSTVAWASSAAAGPGGSI